MHILTMRLHASSWTPGSQHMTRLTSVLPRGQGGKVLLGLPELKDLHRFVHHMSPELAQDIGSVNAVWRRQG